MAGGYNSNILVSWYLCLVIVFECYNMYKGSASAINGSPAFQDCPMKCSCQVVARDVVVNCSGRSLDTIPEQIPLDATILLLSVNRITEIPNYAFKRLRKLRHLDLSHNDELDIYDFSFYNLTNLEILDICNIRKLSLSYNRPFGHLYRLKRLIMRFVDHVNYTSLDRAIRDVTELEYFCITWAAPGPLTQGFTFLKKLKILDLYKSRINVTIETFRVLSNLTIERLSIRELAELTENDFPLYDPYALSNLKFLKVVDISNNYGLYPDNSCYKIISILQSFKNSTSLETLIMDFSMVSLERLPTTLEADIFAPLKDVKLKRLSLQSNRISVVYPFFKYLRHLEYINLDYNYMSFIPTGPNSFVTDVVATKNLTEAHLSNQNPTNDCEQCWLLESPLFLASNSIDTRSSTINTAYLSGNFRDVRSTSAVHFSSDIKRVYVHHAVFRKLPLDRDDLPDIIDITNVTMHGIIFSFRNRLTVLDLSSCRFNRMPTTFKGLNDLKEVNLAGNYMEYMHPMFLKRLPNLQRLFMSDNRLGFFSSENALAQLFSDLQNLSFLELNNNALTTIPSEMFRNCPKLETVKLANNSIIHAKFVVDNLQNMRYIDLQHNQLLTFNRMQIHALEKVASNHQLVLNLKGNGEFQCICENMPFVQWFQDQKRKVIILNNSTLTCTMLNGSRVAIAQVDFPAMQLECFRKELIIIIVSCTCGFIVVGILLWHHKWTLKYWYYLMKLKLKKQPLGADGHRNRRILNEFDVYLSCPDMNPQWSRDILQKLEEMDLVVFFLDRDSIPGANVYEEIVRGIDGSKKLLFCVNNNIMDNRQNFELEISYTRGIGFIVPILTEDAPVAQLPKPLLRLLRVGVYLEWPSEARDDDKFWKNVQKAVCSKKGICIRKNGCVIYYAN